MKSASRPPSFGTISLAKVADPDGAPSRVVVSCTRNGLLRRNAPECRLGFSSRFDDDNSSLGKDGGSARSLRAHPAARARGVRASPRSHRTPPRSLRFSSPPPRVTAAPLTTARVRSLVRGKRSTKSLRRVLASLERRSERPARNHGVRSRRASAQNHQGTSGRCA